MNRSQRERLDLAEQELAYLQALVWETVHLEMNGPAHQLAKENGFKSIELDHLRRAVGNRRAVEIYSEPRIAHQGWPWPDRTPVEILKHLSHERRNTE